MSEEKKIFTEQKPSFTLPRVSTARPGNCSLSLNARRKKTNCWSITPTHPWRTGALPGKAYNLQRGVWMLARVYTVLGQCSFRRTTCCSLPGTDRKISRNNSADFDFAFAYECMARARALAGDRIEAQKYADMAEKAGAAIQDEEDRQIFFDDFKSGEWFGAK